MREVFKLDDELRGMILKGILDDLGEYHLTERLASSVVTTESAKVNFHIRDQAIQFQERDHLYILHPGTEMEAKFPISVSELWGNTLRSSMQKLSFAGISRCGLSPRTRFTCR